MSDDFEQVAFSGAEFADNTGAERFGVKEGVRTFGDVSSPEWSDAFAMCIIHSNDTAASDRLMREGSRALDAYEDAVFVLNETP